MTAKRGAGIQVQVEVFGAFFELHDATRLCPVLQPTAQAGKDGGEQDEGEEGEGEEEEGEEEEDEEEMPIDSSEDERPDWRRRKKRMRGDE